MSPLPQRFQAVETGQQVMQCINDLKRKMVFGAQSFADGTVYWHPRLGIATSIYPYTWHSRELLAVVFGHTTIRFKQNQIVQINPPLGGIGKKFQGVVALDRHNRRWLLHRGGMQIVGRRIVGHESLAMSSHPKGEVAFSDGSSATCFIVGCLDDQPKALQRHVATFVRECQRIRDVFQFDEETAKENEYLDVAETEEAEEGDPENEGTHVTPPRDGKVVQRRHAKVCNQLKRDLKKLEKGTTAKRVGRFGPDLRTVGKKPVLFEIKTSVYAEHIQQAVGQLMLYEHVLGKPYRKVMVIPKGLPSRFTQAVAALGIRVVHYSWKLDKPVIDCQQLAAAFGK